VEIFERFFYGLGVGVGYEGSFGWD